MLVSFGSEGSLLSFSNIKIRTFLGHSNQISAPAILKIRKLGRLPLDFVHWKIFWKFQLNSGRKFFGCRFVPLCANQIISQLITQISSQLITQINSLIKNAGRNTKIQTRYSHIFEGAGFNRFAKSIRIRSRIRTTLIFKTRNVR